MIPLTSNTIWHTVETHLSHHENTIVALRRHLHRHPELGWHEHNTQRHLKAWLAERGLQATAMASTGLYVDIGRGAAPMIYRADIDALPIGDGKDPQISPYTSTVPGVCHACGHDFHTAVAAGVAWALKIIEPQLPGRVRVVFQPAEETVPSGADAMLQEGILENMHGALALHVDPTRTTGRVGLRVGPLTCAADAFVIDVGGMPGHSARPHLSRDALLAAADIVRALYTLIPQRVDPLETAVLNVGMIQGGEAPNIIAGRVRLEGMVRTLRQSVRELVHGEMRAVTEATAAIHGCRAALTLHQGSPPVVNDPHLHAVVADACRDVLGVDGIENIPDPSTGGEDFGTFTRRGPVYMLRMGVTKPGRPIYHLHTPEFDVDEDALTLAIRIMTRAIVHALDT